MELVECTGCSETVRPVVSLDVVEGGGTVVLHTCPKCGYTLGTADGEEPKEPEARAKTQRATKARNASEPLNVLKEAKKRLRFVRREEKRLAKEHAKFQKERQQLEKLLAAAETPVAAVSPIRRAK